MNPPQESSVLDMREGGIVGEMSTLLPAHMIDLAFFSRVWHMFGWGNPTLTLLFGTIVGKSLTLYT